MRPCRGPRPTASTMTPSPGRQQPRLHGRHPRQHRTLRSLGFRQVEHLQHGSESASTPRTGVVVVKYDAWKFGGSMLQRNFLRCRRELEMPRQGPRQPQQHHRSSPPPTRSIPRAELSGLLLGRSSLRSSHRLIYVAGMAGTRPRSARPRGSTKRAQAHPQRASPSSV